MHIAIAAHPIGHCRTALPDYVSRPLRITSNNTINNINIKEACDLQIAMVYSFVEAFYVNNLYNDDLE